jgi:tripartite-type tricarboxylate transporter receptor subunit TctC
MTLPALPRRQLLAALALPFIARAAQASPDANAMPDDRFPRGATLLIAGPAGGALDRVADQLGAGLQAHLPAGTQLHHDPVGGVDGVTGANIFANQINPNGATALLVPGAASLAWLAGDSRVHFDPSRWLPILARTTPAFVVGRTGSPAIGPGTRLRVASGGPISPALAAMLAVDLLGADVHPVYGLGDDDEALAALVDNRVDVVLLRGQQHLASLNSRATDVTPQFALGTPSADGTFERDPLAPNVPTLVEYNAGQGYAPTGGVRFAAWACSASAAQLQYALVLPGLSPASTVALWRGAGAQALAPDLASSVEIVYDSAASAVLRALCPSGAALLQLRGWLADRLGWQPG